MQKLRNILFFILLSSVYSCGGSSLGGVEAGNPPSASVTGTLVSGESNLVRMAVNGCPADTVIATNSSGTSTTASVNSDCSFTLSLTRSRAYLISVVNDGLFVASLVFNRTNLGDTTTILFLPSGSGNISLGTITITGGQGRVTNQPYNEIDSDDDGISDLDDDDDDNDGIDDDSESDCDLDGFWGDFDDDDGCEDSDDDEEDQSGSGEIFAVSPPNDRNLDDQIGRVEIDADISFRTDCAIDETSLSSTTFNVISDLQEVVSCDFSLDNSDTSVRCEHENDFQLDTIYTVTISGVSCLDSTFLTETSWQFITVEN